MAELSVWFKFTLAVLACWRLAHMLAREDGPFDLLVRLRAWLGNSNLGRLMDCFYCLSVWMAIPLAFFVCQGTANRVVAWLAISGGACLIDKFTHEPLAIQSLDEIPQEGEETEDGMLRTKTDDPQ
mgnify:CR=1 FL=1